MPHPNHQMTADMCAQNLEGFSAKLDNSQSWDDFFQRSIARARLASEKYPKRAGLSRANSSMNRYSDVIPFDATRVVLPTTDHRPSDYINASHVTLPSVDRKYIAAQGPMPNTVVDFWRMLLDNDVKVVAMTTNLRENGRDKCAKYWPTVGQGESQLAPGLTLETTWEEEYNGHVARKVTAQLDGREHTIVHHHFIGWPDHGVPNQSDIFLQFLDAVNESVERLDPSKPVVVNCSAGIGRTGTFVCVDVCRALLRAGQYEQVVSLPQIVHTLRLQRANMVQSCVQMRFCFQTVAKLARQTVGGEEEKEEEEEEEHDQVEEEHDQVADEDDQAEEEYDQVEEDQSGESDDEWEDEEEVTTPNVSVQEPRRTVPTAPKPTATTAPLPHKPTVSAASPPAPSAASSSSPSSTATTLFFVAAAAIAVVAVALYTKKK